jgi:cytoskeleton protein RodZ
MDDQPADTHVTAGKRLQALREKNEWSVEDVASELNLKGDVIRGLESDDFSALPERTYVRGYLRSYARLLGIQESEVLEDLPEIKRSRGGLGSVLPVMGGAELRNAHDVPKTAVFKPASKTWIRPTLLSCLALVLILVAWWVSGLRPSTVNGGPSDNHADQNTSTKKVILPTAATGDDGATNN